MSSDTRSPTWRTVNISRGERTGRGLIGVVGIGAAIVLLASVGSAVSAVLELLLVAAGLDMLVTGATGHGPLYQRLGHVPRSLRGAR